jgi:hypothetical protein
MLTIETPTGYNVSGEIVRKRDEDGLVLALSESNGTYAVYLCAERTRHLGRKHTQYLEWLSFRDDGQHFDSRDAAIAYAMGY